MTRGGVAERSIALVLKTGDRKVRGFESHPRRQFQNYSFVIRYGP